jgi:hypothetical protein
MDASEFSKIAAGLQSIITAIGIIVGGAWVLYTFWHLGTAEKSRAELIDLDLKKRTGEEELAERQPILSIDLKWRQQVALRTVSASSHCKQNYKMMVRGRFNSGMPTFWFPGYFSNPESLIQTSRSFV